MEDDLIERLKDIRDEGGYGQFLLDSAARGALDEAIDALSPVLSEEVETTADNLRHAHGLMLQIVDLLVQYGQNRSDFENITEGSCLLRGADLIERLYCEYTFTRHERDKRQQRIEELEERNRNLNIVNRDQWMHNKRLDAALAEIENTAKHCVGRYYKRITEIARKARAGE